jgi:hypothetical protein
VALIYCVNSLLKVPNHHDTGQNHHLTHGPPTWAKVVYKSLQRNFLIYPCVDTCPLHIGLVASPEVILMSVFTFLLHSWVNNGRLELLRELDDDKCHICYTVETKLERCVTVTSSSPCVLNIRNWGWNLVLRCRCFGPFKKNGNMVVSRGFDILICRESTYLIFHWRSIFPQIQRILVIFHPKFPRHYL